MGKDRRITSNSQVIVDLDEARKTVEILLKVKPEKYHKSNEVFWRLEYLKSQIKTRHLEKLYVHYSQKIYHGYFSLFLIIQVCTSIIHLGMVLYSNMSKNKHTINLVILEIVLYSIVVILCIIGLIVTEVYVKKKLHYLKVATGLAFLLHFAVDITVPLAHICKDSFRPANTFQLIIGCYIFFGISKMYISAILGFFVAAVDVSLIFMTYKDSDMKFERLGADITYFACINGLGLYLRLMNEIVTRKSFLERRQCVESTLQLKFEKNQEEQLLLTIIPENIFTEVRTSVYENIKNIMHKNVIPKKNSHLKSYDNVTILYADIVNYTQMTVKLTIQNLVETLNELFGLFDDASEELGVLRIKFLGDCYYCVSGLPPRNNKEHADACVQLGLRMISNIKRVRERRQLDVDMRIGVHTGSLVSGIIGLRKWQFDVWSNDVYIANRMETTGQSGKVHITKQTKDQLTKDYDIEPTTVGLNDALLKKNNIETFLVSPVEDEITELPSITQARISTPLIEENSNESQKDLQSVNAIVQNNLSQNSSPVYQRRESRLNNLNTNLGRRLSGNPTRYLNGSRNSSLNEKRLTADMKRRTAFMDNNIRRYTERLKNSDEIMEEEIVKMPLSIYDHWFKVKDINPLLLLYRDQKLEVEYIKRADPLFKFYMLAVVILLTSVIILQSLVFVHWRTTTIFIYTTLLLVLVLLPIIWAQYAWITCHEKDEAEEYAKPAGAFNVIYQLSQLFIDNAILRTSIYFLIFGLSAAYIFKEMVNWKDGLNLKGFMPWHMTEICSLIIIISFVFLRIQLWIKLILTCVVAVFYSYFVWEMNELYNKSETYNYMMEPIYAHILSIVYLMVTLCLTVRHIDYMNKLDFQWSKKLSTEEEKAYIMHAANTSLLLNILPQHVATIYLNEKRQSTDLYTEEYVNVAVMFASVVDYNVEDDLKILTLMNAVICDFDNLLYKHTQVEKIKVVNWTYMAACGLDNGEAKTSENSDHVATALVKFAVDMMTALVKINRATQQELKLRIGISHGDVTAGVVGSKKPLYDIWGDTVNMASRMDSTGTPGKIQVTDHTAMILKEQGYLCDFRGHIYVKGKSLSPNVPDVPTHFVTLISDYNRPVKLVRESDIPHDDSVHLY